MYEWFLENFNKDKKEIVDNKYEHMYCSLNFIENKIAKLKNINLELPSIVHENLGGEGSQ